MAPKRKASATAMNQDSSYKMNHGQLARRPAAAPKPQEAPSKRRRVLKEVTYVTAGGYLGILPPPLHPGQIPPIESLPTEIINRILEVCDTITRICLALSNKKLFFQSNFQLTWYKKTIPIPQNLYLNSRALGGNGGRSLSLRMLLKGFIKGSSGMSGWIPGTRGDNTHEVVWNWHIKKFQKLEDHLASQMVAKQYLDDIMEYRARKWERREKRMDKRSARKKGVKKERREVLRAEREKKRDELNCGDEDADTGESELDDGEVEAVEEKLMKKWPKVDSDSDTDTGY